MELQARVAALTDRSQCTPSSNSGSSSNNNCGSTPAVTASSSNTSNETMTPPVVPVELPPPGSPQRFPSQRPYKYGMVMLCLGALINWMGLAESNIEPVRYIGVACIVTGAMLIIAAMCCWMNSNAPPPSNYENASVHVIEVPENNTCTMKPPDYESIIQAPPSYDVAVKLNPAQLIHAPTSQPTETVVTIEEETNIPPPSYVESTQTTTSTR